MLAQTLRNLAIVAHVDHGKTTLIDAILQQSGSLGRGADGNLDSNDLEKERGITILAKNTAIDWKDYRINIVDTPGHADFGGEVERVLSMVDSVLLLVDAMEGPMPQTRFVTQKAFKHGLKPIVVINKVDRPGVDLDKINETIDAIFDLFLDLDATEEQADFPIIYASGLNGYASLKYGEVTDNMSALLDLIIERVPAPDVDPDGPFQMQISSLDYSSYIGAIAIGRVQRGTITANSPVVIIDSEGNERQGRILQIMNYRGIERIEEPMARAGQIICVTGITAPRISDTICHPKTPEALPKLTVDLPTVSMMFCVNTSPLAGKEGKFVTSRQILERLERELIHNVALSVEITDASDRFRVSGRGELHLGILIETMRREGFEFAVSRPEVVLREIDGEVMEPYENLFMEMNEENQGPVIAILGQRKAQLVTMSSDNKGRIRLEYVIPTRGLIGLHNEFLTMTSGSGLWTHVFDHYGPYQKGVNNFRTQGAIISNAPGKTSAYALWNLQERGRLFVDPQTEVYEGMVVGVSSKEHDLVVNVLRGKQLTNIRASGSDEHIVLVPPIKMSLEKALEFINDDELVEVTPQSIRVRKRYLKEHERKRDARSSNG